MFSSNNRSTRLTCGFKVNTNCPEWHKSMTRILKKIKGGDISLDAKEGMAYITGEGDPNEILKLMGSRKGRAAEMTFLKTDGDHHLHHHHHPHSSLNLFNNSKSYCGQQPPSYNSYWPSDNGNYSRQQHQPYYSQLPAMQPFHHQNSYPGPGYGNYGYY